MLLSIAHGLRISDTLPDGVTADSLLSTSSSAYSKAAGYDSTTYEKEDGDIDALSRWALPSPPKMTTAARRR